MSATSRRPNGKPSTSQQSSKYTTSSTTTRSKISNPQRLKSQQPLFHPPELLLLLTYPALLLLGSLFSLLDPSARAAPYSATLQSHPADQAPTYFALKRNVFNRYFVKVGWFWFTVAWMMWVGVGRGMVRRAKGWNSGERVVELDDDEKSGEEEGGVGNGGGGGWVLTPRRLRSVVRWGVVTVWWMLVTQWCFGPALIDRGFTYTGGQCELLRNPYEREEMGEVREFVTATACKLAGGQWKGGHDISGHVFILVLGSASVGLEILGGLMAARREEVDEGDGEGGGRLGKWGWGFVGGVVGMSWWMLLMTAAYFHTWFEKFTGLLTAFLGIAVVYLLPRLSPQVRDVLGIPGR
ncbi:MAG: hypothetical protein LQ350_007560 [Teloschistes chrysophthalmus]|nr:MAG: hypothetical protein LQ350_007560 [Niorma chrysophthalma]